MTGAENMLLGHFNREEPVLMGIVNVSPDSFSDGGQFYNKNKVVDHSYQLVKEGAHIIDIGGESTRPGSQVVDVQEEIDRVCPVIEKVKEFASFISIDTRNAATMKAAIESGANAVNDISGLTHDNDSIGVVSSYQAPVFIMHMQGTPQNMQLNPIYNNVVEDVFKYLDDRVKACVSAGIDKTKVVVDPGIGFGKSVSDNLQLINNIDKFHDLGCPVLLGASRKSFIAALSQNEGAKERLAGSLSSVLWGLSKGVQFFRIHDVKETKQSIEIYRAIQNAR